jgi:hypothetical protein
MSVWENLPGDAAADNVATEDMATDGVAAGEVAAGSTGGVRRVRRVVARVVTALAFLLVLFALVAPNQTGHFTPGAFVRIPVEGLLGVALMVVLPARARRVVATIAGVVLALLTLLKILDIGFFGVLDRPFDPVLDWTLFDDAFGFLTDSIGRAGAIGAAVAAVLLAIAMFVFMTLSVLRLTRLVVRHRTTASRAVGVLAAVWVACALLSVQIVPGVPIASTSEAALAYDRAVQVRAGVQDQLAFASQSAVDAFRNTPGDQLLTALRGKDVIFSFVESYGRDAIENPGFSSQINALLDAGTRQLNAAGFASRSAFLTSSTSGGGSWLAHSTFQSGLWIDNQRRYNDLLSSKRVSLASAFKRANWRTVGVEPGNTRDWPEGVFYGYNEVYDSRNLGYHGWDFSWSTMPDQFTMSAFQRLEYSTPNRGPLMAEVTLTSSHTPWAPLPQFIGWNDVGDGSEYIAQVKAGLSPDVVWRDASRVRTEYARSIEYSLNSLISYVATYGDKNLVLVFLGDHQPAPIVVGEGASRDVPITIIAHDPAVLDRISGWGWQDGLRPGPRAPVWRMDTFRDRFLTTFGPQPAPTRSPSPPNR